MSETHELESYEMSELAESSIPLGSDEDIILSQEVYNGTKIKDVLKETHLSIKQKRNIITTMIEQLSRLHNDDTSPTGSDDFEEDSDDSQETATRIAFTTLINDLLDTSNKNDDNAVKLLNTVQKFLQKSGNASNDSNIFADLIDGIGTDDDSI